MCTRILVMREGELVAELDGATATELEILRHAMPGTQQMVTAGAPGSDEARERGGAMTATEERSVDAADCTSASSASRAARSSRSTRCSA